MSPSMDTPVPVPLANTNLFAISVVLSFREHYVNGIVQYITFEDWLFFFIWHTSMKIIPNCCMYL